MSKVCNTCNQEKPLAEFRKDKKIPDGHARKCTTCVKAYQADYYLKHKEKIDASNKRWDAANKEKRKEYVKQYRADNKAVVAEKSRVYQQANRAKIREYERKYEKEHAEHITQRKKEYYQANSKTIQEKYNQRIKANPELRIKRNLRFSLQRFVKTKGKGQMIEKLLCMSFNEFKAHIESQFTPEMSWDNCGTYWHFDHIVPCSFFDQTTDEGLKACWHYSNLRPLEAKENLRKNGSLEAILPINVV